MVSAPSQQEAKLSPLTLQGISLVMPAAWLTDVESVADALSYEQVQKGNTFWSPAC